MSSDPITPDQARLRPTSDSKAAAYARTIMREIDLHTDTPNHQRKYTFSADGEVSDEAAGILRSKGWTVSREMNVREILPCSCTMMYACDHDTVLQQYNEYVVEW